METAQLQKSNVKPEVRFGFVGLLFALTAAEIGIQFGDVVTKADTFGSGAPAYAHLMLALFIVATSWVGWSKSNAPGAQRDVKDTFSADFIVLLIDVLLVIFYFILVKGVDVDRTPNSPFAITPSAANEALWVLAIFVGYFAWDFITKAIIVGSYPDGRNIIGFKFFDGAFWKRGYVSVVCMILAFIAWRLVKDETIPDYVMLSDLALLSLVLLFRAMKQEARYWMGFLATGFVIALAIVHLRLLERI